jgi:hypothetical protein
MPAKEHLVEKRLVGRAEEIDDHPRFSVAPIFDPENVWLPTGKGGQRRTEAAIKIRG